MGTRMLQRRGTAAEWAAGNPVLADGEIGYERDTRVLKIGDGVTAWTALVSAWQTILPINAAGVGLTIQGRAAQVGDLLVALDTTGANKLARISNTGGVHGNYWNGIRTTALPGASNSMSQGATNNIGLVVKKYAAATSDTFSVVDENNNVMFSVRSDGLTGNASGGNYFNAVSTNSTVMLTNSKAIGQVGHIIRGFLGQTGDLLQAQDSTLAVLAKFTSNGSLVINSAAPRNAMGNVGVLGSTILTLSAGFGDGTGTTMLTIRGKAGQSADYQNWQDSTGAALLAVDKGGHLAGRGSVPTVAAQAALGTTPPAPTVVGSDQGCTISFGTGTTPTAGWMLRLNFNRPYSGIGAVALTPGNSQTVALGIPYIVNVGVNNIDIGFPNVPAASQAVGVYKLHATIIGN